MNCESRTLNSNKKKQEPGRQCGCCGHLAEVARSRTSCHQDAYHQPCIPAKIPHVEKNFCVTLCQIIYRILVSWTWPGRKLRAPKTLQKAFFTRLQQMKQFTKQIQKPQQQQVPLRVQISYQQITHLQQPPRKYKSAGDLNTLHCQQLSMSTYLHLPLWPPLTMSDWTFSQGQHQPWCSPYWPGDHRPSSHLDGRQQHRGSRPLGLWQPEHHNIPHGPRTLQFWHLEWSLAWSGLHGHIRTASLIDLSEVLIGTLVLLGHQHLEVEHRVF